MFSELFRRLAFFLRRGQRQRELQEEIEHHLELKARAELERDAGATPAAAKSAALRGFGNPLLLRERSDDAWGWRWLVDLGRDLRHGLRLLSKTPGLTAAAVVTLALGIGANAAIFSMVNWLLFRPLAAPEVVIIDGQIQSGGVETALSYPDYREISEQSHAVFSGVAGANAFNGDGLAIRGRSEQLLADYVTGDFFQVMGVRPTLGRLIAPEDDHGSRAAPVLVLSYSYWQARFAGDRKILGQSALVDGHPVTIIGVAAKGYHGPMPLLDAQGYMPLGEAATTGDQPPGFSTDRKNDVATLFARLRPGVSLERAQAEIGPIGRRLAAQYPETNARTALVVLRLGSGFAAYSGPSGAIAIELMGGLFLALAGLVLLVACVNVASLLLARAAARAPEMAFRVAVGAGRGRLVRQMLAESLLLAAFGCAGGIGLGLICARWLAGMRFGGSFPLILDFAFDWHVFAYATGAAVVAGLVAGLAPALRAGRANVSQFLHERAASAAGGQQRLRSALVVAEIGGSLALLIIAGLFVRSLWGIANTRLGFNPKQVVNFTLAPSEAGFNQAQGEQFYARALRRVRSLPGVETASFAATVPAGYSHMGLSLRVPDYHAAPGGRGPFAGYNIVSSEYFRVMGIPLVRGRAITDADTAGAARVAVINQTMAAEYWPGGNPIGKTIADSDQPSAPITIVGIAANSHTANLSSPPVGYLYVALAQNYHSHAILQVRAALPPAEVVLEVRNALHTLAPAVPVFGVQTMPQALETLNGYLLFRLGAGLVGALGLLGLLLALVGVYGVMAYATGQRTHEIGVRMALGARPAQVLALVLRQGMIIIAAGIALGLFVAEGFGSVAGHFVVGVSPRDPATYMAAVVLLAVTALAACYVPARRALEVDPMLALRAE